MAKKKTIKLFDKKGFEWWHAVVIVAGIVLIWYLFFMEKPECISDEDCPEGYICNLLGVCEPKPASTWDLWAGPLPDKRCFDNIAASAGGDPDCPAFCPVGSPLAREGLGGLCCYDDAGTQALDCDTMEPFFETEMNNYGEEINILPNYPVGSYESFVTSRSAEYKWWPKAGTEPAEGGIGKNVRNYVTWNAPTDYPGDVTTMDIWMDKVTIEIKDQGPDISAWSTAWKTAVLTGTSTLLWNDATVGTSGSLTTITGDDENKFTGQLPSSTGRWDTPIFSLDDLDYGKYEVAYYYCFGNPAEDYPYDCDSPPMTYILKVSSDEISFTISAALPEQS